MTAKMRTRAGARWTRISERVLGPSGVQRERSAHSLLAALIFVVFAGMQQFEVRCGLIDQTESNWLSAYTLAGSLSFFAFIRSGRNLRLATDRSLTFAQCLFGVSATCGSYAITGPARGGIMAIMLLILVFAMFALKPRRIQLLSTLAAGLLVSVMVWKSLTDPVRYPAWVEVTHATIAVILMSSISVLSLQLGALRGLLQRQKAELQRAVEQNERLATTDELTGLVNRRRMGVILELERERQRRGGKCMSVALIDIDFFKRVNDVHGHAAGDTVLREFAKLATATIRLGDTVARWGGEEFLIVMPATSTEEACLAIERLRQAFSGLRFPTIDAAMRATFSAGIATHLDLETVQELVDRADQNMYAAKTAGRDRVFGGDTKASAEAAPAVLSVSAGEC
jgi:diguanylate cyclase